MKTHIVGGGFGGLAAAAYLIRNAGVSGQDITVYEADEQMGGGFSLGGSAQTGYSLPGSVFDSEFRCTFDLLQTIPSASDPAVSVKDEFFAFNTQHPFRDRAHIVDRNGHIVPHGPHFGRHSQFASGCRDGMQATVLAPAMVERSPETTQRAPGAHGLGRSGAGLP
jgi:oleate hydratase